MTATIDIPARPLQKQVLPLRPIVVPTENVRHFAEQAAHGRTAASLVCYEPSMIVAGTVAHMAEINLWQGGLQIIERPSKRMDVDVFKHGGILP